MNMRFQRRRLLSKLKLSFPYSRRMRLKVSKIQNCCLKFVILVLVICTVSFLYALVVNFIEYNSIFLSKYDAYNIPRDARIPGEPDIQLLSFDEEPLSTPHIFFADTGNHPTWRGRELCAFEAAARNNPFATVYALSVNRIVTPTVATEKVLEAHSNLRLRHYNLEKEFEGTELYDWYTSKVWKQGPSRHAPRHLSDAVRYLLLLKHGGTYLDTDVINLRPLDQIPNNTLAEEPNYAFFKVNGAVLVNFEKRHPLIQRAMELGARTYKPENWGTIGPDLLTTILLENAKYFETSRHPVNIVAYQYFHPIRGILRGASEALSLQNLFQIGWPTSGQYFDASRKEAREMKEALSFSYTFHLFESGSAALKVDPTSDQPIAMMARQHCPVALKYSVHF